MLRNNHQRCSVRKSVLKNFEKFTGKHLCQSLLFNKIEALTTASECCQISFRKIPETAIHTDSKQSQIEQQNILLFTPST